MTDDRKMLLEWHRLWSIQQAMSGGNFSQKQFASLEQSFQALFGIWPKEVPAILDEIERFKFARSKIWNAQKKRGIRRRRQNRKQN